MSEYLRGFEDGTKAMAEKAAQHIPVELLGEICADVMVGTYGLTGSLTRAKMDVEKRISQWLRSLAGAEPQDKETK